MHTALDVSWSGALEAPAGQAARRALAVGLRPAAEAAPRPRRRGGGGAARGGAPGVLAGALLPGERGPGVVGVLLARRQRRVEALDNWRRLPAAARRPQALAGLQRRPGCPCGAGRASIATPCSCMMSFVGIHRQRL